MKQFADIKAQIEKISGEISEYCYLNTASISTLSLNEEDLSLRKLSEYQSHLRSLQGEKVCIQLTDSTLGILSIFFPSITYYDSNKNNCLATYCSMFVLQLSIECEGFEPHGASYMKCFDESN